MKVQAIALCRVSTPEQTLSNSLNRQEANVIQAAKTLDATILADGWWSGDVSSKAGTNVKRKDLNAMLAYCKIHKQVKYLIVDECDRFMRSLDELFYFEVKFRELGVTVWYASEPELNTSDLTAKLLKAVTVFRAEGSNVERQHKSINGHNRAIMEGRYTFPPKPGYMKGTEPGIHIPHPDEFKPFQAALKEVVSGLYTPSEALKKLNQSSFTSHRPPLKNDKFRKFLISPYYAGILEVNKQVKAHCESGRHQPMITLSEHERLKEIIIGAPPKRYWRKQENPEFPLANQLQTDDCKLKSKVSGFNKVNGKQNGWQRAKYRCRNCSKEYDRSAVHDSMSEQLALIDLSGSSLKRLLAALSQVWEARQQGRSKDLSGLNQRLVKINKQKADLVMAIADPSNAIIKSDLQDQVKEIKDQVQGVEQEIANITSNEPDWFDFVSFALKFIADLKNNWWSLRREQRLWCEKILYPGGIFLKSDQKVHTPEISRIFRLATNKKAQDYNAYAFLVELRGIAPRSAKLRTTHLQA